MDGAAEKGHLLKVLGKLGESKKSPNTYQLLFYMIYSKIP